MASADTQGSGEIYSKVTVFEELAVAVELTTAGMRALIPEGGTRPELDATLQQLAAGFERFSKLTYIEAVHHSRDVRPAGKELRRFGHDILAVIDALVEVVAGTDEYSRRSPAQEDLAFIRADQGLRELLGALSHFGKGGRYSRIDALVDPNQADVEEEPGRQWDAIELGLFMQEPNWETLIEEPDAELIGARLVVGRLHRLARAMARIWAWGALGEEGTRHVGMLYAFLTAGDEQLGVELSRP